jgi:hypothetical protein
MRSTEPRFEPGLLSRRVYLDLLASSSIAALVLGAGTAWAAPCNNPITGAFNNPGVVTNVCVQNTSFAGAITNQGTITPNGIAFQNGTVTGHIVSTNVVDGGISLDGNSQIIATAVQDGILLRGSFTGGISNAGQITADQHGIIVGGDNPNGSSSNIVTNFSGGISNSGTISVIAVASGFAAIRVGGDAYGSGASHVIISTFSGGISNSGMISATNGNVDGIRVGGGVPTGFNDNSVEISLFSGGINNNGGTIAAQQHGIFVGGDGLAGTFSLSSFAGGISNSGTITAATGNGIFVGGAQAGFATTGSATISTSPVVSPTVAP